jgi:hypothetical protein
MPELLLNREVFFLPKSDSVVDHIGTVARLETCRSSYTRSERNSLEPPYPLFGICRKSIIFPERELKRLSGFLGQATSVPPPSAAWSELWRFPCAWAINCIPAQATTTKKILTYSSHPTCVTFASENFLDPKFLVHNP